MGWVAHRKWKESKQHPSMLPGPAVPSCCLSSFHFLWAIHPIRPTPFPHVCVSLSLSVLSLLLLLFPSSHSTIYFQAEDIPTEPNEAADDVAAKAEAEKVSINSYTKTVTFFIALHGIRR